MSLKYTVRHLSQWMEHATGPNAGFDREIFLASQGIGPDHCAARTRWLIGSRERATNVFAFLPAKALEAGANGRSLKKFAAGFDSGEYRLVDVIEPAGAVDLSISSEL